MTQTVRAVWANGVLTPNEPLSLAEGTAVEVMVTNLEVARVEAASRVMAAANSPDFWRAVEEAVALDPDTGEDALANLERYRREAGRPPLFADGIPET